MACEIASLAASILPRTSWHSASTTAALRRCTMFFTPFSATGSNSRHRCAPSSLYWLACHRDRCQAALLCTFGSEPSVTRFCKSLSARSVKPKLYKRILRWRIFFGSCSSRFLLLSALFFSVFFLRCLRFLLLAAACFVAPCPKSLLLFVTCPDVLRFATGWTSSTGPTLSVSGRKTYFIVLTNCLAGNVYL